MKKLNSILWGIILIAIGIVFALNAFDIVNINLFFDGWWTLFIIVPCVVGLFSGKDITGNLIGILVGVFLMLCCQNVLSFDMLWKLAIPAVIIIIGIKIIVNSFFDTKSAEVRKRMKESGIEPQNGFAAFSETKMNYDGQEFNGAELNAIFGSVKCDLQNAVIKQDCVITATSIFGGIVINVPENVNVKINSNSIFGGVSNKKHVNSKESAVTVYINATSMFGGVDIK